MIGRLIKYIDGHRWQFTLALLLAIGTILAGIGLMTSSGYLISRAAQRPHIVDLFMITAAVRFFGISRAVVRYFERLVSHDLTFNILHQMRISLYRKLNVLPHKWLMGQKTGNILSGIITDIDTLQNVYLRIISPIIVAIIISIITLSGVALFNFSLTLAILFCFLISGLAVPLLVSRLTKGRGKKDVTTRTKLKTFLVDQLQGLNDLTWLGQKQNSRERFNEMQYELDNLQTRNASTAGLAEGINSFVTGFSMLIVFIMTAPLVADGKIEGVWLAALTLGVLSSFEALQGLANAFIQYESAQEASRRLFAITRKTSNKLNHQAELDDYFPEKELEIDFRNVSFSYDHEHITLENISFCIPQGSKTAIVGPTGSGKSTLINLITGLWEPGNGTITINNHDITTLNKSSYRAFFGVISQDAYVFNRSLRENIKLAKPDAKDIEIADALEKAGLSSFAQNLDAEPGNLGIRLSGGEKQLLALARVLLINPRIWIFDEPTAHTDVITERKTLETLRKLVQDNTMLLITHRLVDMEKMDQIIVMHEGKIAERGKHHELLDRQGIYTRMYQQQSGIISK